MDNQAATKRVKVLLLMTGVVVGAALLVFILFRSSSQEIYFKSTGVKIKHGITTSTEDSHLLVATNRNLVSYEPISGETTPRMRDGPLPDISDIRWSPNQRFAVFQAIGARSDDVLGSILTSNGSSLASSTWWLADLTDKTYTPLDISAQKVDWVDNSNIYLVGSPSNQKYGVYQASIDDLNYERVVTDKTIIDAHSTPQGFLVHHRGRTTDEPSDEEHFHFTQPGTVSKVVDGESKPIMSDVSRPISLNHKGTVAAVYQSTGQDDTDNLNLIDTITGEPIQTMATGQLDFGTWAGKDSNYYFRESDTGDVIHVKLTNNDSVDISKMTTDPNEHAEFVLLVGGNGQMYARYPDNYLYVITRDEKMAVKTYKKEGAEINKITGDGFTIYYNPTYEIYDVFVTKSPYEEFQDKALEAINKSGFNSNLVDLTYDAERITRGPATGP